MDAGRGDGRTGAAGFSLIELMVSISILGVLLAMALPAFSDWMRNNQVRVVAETMREGLQLARSEAVKRNVRTRMQLVTSLDNNCALSSSGPYWIVTAGGASVSPVGSCASPVSGSATPYVVQASPVTAAATKVVVSMTTPAQAVAVVAFDASGRLAATANPTYPVATTTIAVSSAGGTCVLGGGTVRCLNVVVFPAGEVRMCDPSQTSVTDPTRC